MANLKWHRILGIALILSATFAAGIWLTWRWRNQYGPKKVALALIEAINQKNWDTLAQIVHPVEREKLGLTTDRIRLLGETLIAPIWMRIGVGQEVQEAKNLFWLTPEEEKVFLRNMQVYQILRKDGRKGAIIVIERTEIGWKANLTFFIYTLIIEGATKGKVDKRAGLTAMRRLGLYYLFVGKEALPLLFE